MLPKIFLYKTVWDEMVHIYALAEDGSSLIGDIIWNAIYARQDLTSHISRKIYDEYYPEGYELVDLLDATDKTLESNGDYMAAFQRNVSEADKSERGDKPVQPKAYPSTKR